MPKSGLFEQALCKMVISLLPDYTVGIYKHVSLGNAPLPGLRQGISSASQAMLINDNRGNQQAYLSPHTIRLTLQSNKQGRIKAIQEFGLGVLFGWLVLILTKGKLV